MKIGMSTNTFAGEPLENILALAREFGIHDIEMWASCTDAIGPVAHEYDWRNRDIEKAARQLREAGVHVGCVSFAWGLRMEYAQDQKLFTQEMMHAIEIAHQLGAETVLHYVRALAPDDSKPDAEKLKLYWQEPLALAEKYGSVLVAENEPDDYTWTPDNMKALMQVFSSPYFKTNYDATNYYHSGCEPFPYAYDVLKEHIGYTHIKNGRIYRPEFCPDPDWLCKEIGMTHSLAGNEMYYVEADAGVVNNIALLRRFHEDGYCGMCTIEPHTTRQNAINAIRREVTFLKGTGYFG